MSVHAIDPGGWGHVLPTFWKTAFATLEYFAARKIPFVMPSLPPPPPLYNFLPTAVNFELIIKLVSIKFSSSVLN